MEMRPGYKQTEVGVIPEDWEARPIGAFIDLLTGFPFPSAGYSNSGVRLLRGSNVKRGVTEWSTEGTEFWPEITPDIQKYVLRVKDIVIAMDGSLVGRSFAMLEEEDLPAVLLQRVARIRSESVAQKYLKAWICSSRFMVHCDSVKTVTAIPHISPSDIRSFIVAIPPTKAEHEAIAEALSDADAFIDSLEQLIAKKRCLKRGAMQGLLAGRTRLPGFNCEVGYVHTDIGVIPGDWVVKPLGALAKLYQPVTISAKQFTEAGFPVYGANGIVGFYNKSNHETWQVAVTCRGSTCGTVNRTVDRCWITGNAMVLNCDHNEALSKEFFYHLVCFQNLSDCITGTGQPQIVRSPLAEFSVALPPTKEEQVAIAAVLSDMDAEIAAVEQKLAKAKDIKQGMMQELLTGRIRLI
jgi:type I restriction enzyme S subunit